MTYQATGSVNTAKANVGYHEGGNNYNKFSPWQGLSPYNPWCASFTCYCAYEGGGFRFPHNSTFREKGEAYCPTMKQRAWEMGLWRDRSWRANPGDFVLYDWGNNGLIDHIELVIADDGVTIITIGGNTSDAVLYRKRDRHYVAGFVALSQSDQAAPPVDWAKIKLLAEWKARVTAKPLELGDRGADVKILNDLLVHKGLLTHTGVAYGDKTREAVRHFKQAHNLQTDGKFDGTHFGGPAAQAILS